MKIHIYTIVRNEEYILPYFLRHYSTFADKIFIIDDSSTDKTVEIAKAHPKVELLDFDYPPSFNYDDNFSDCFTKYYKEKSRGVADWVIRVDADELIYHKDIKKVLKEKRENGAKVLKSTGFLMVSEELAKNDGQIYDEIKEGARYRGYDKTVIFDPSLDITFEKGRHSINTPEGIRHERAHILLLHYRYLSKEYFIKRSEHLYSRKGEMTDEIKEKMMNRGLNWYEENLKSELINLID